MLLFYFAAKTTGNVGIIFESSVCIIRVKMGKQFAMFWFPTNLKEFPGSVADKSF